MLSTRKWANFLPLGRDLTIPGRHFLAAGKGLRGSLAKVTKRQEGGHAGHNRGKANTSK